MGLPPAAVLVVSGLLAHIILNALLRKSMTSAWGIVAPLILGIGLETYEIWVQYRRSGLFAEGNDPLWIILARHGFDVLLVVLVPILLVGLGIIMRR
jgi:hypothetical protein